jgi:conjugal transfer pilus assembly protein TrbC
MKKLLALFLSFAVPAAAFADDSLLDTMTARWDTYIFVSTHMPRADVIALAREASLAHAIVVLNGFGGADGTLVSTERFAAEINAACCGKRPAHWVIDPVLAQRYHVVAAPTFVVAHGQSDNGGDYSAVSGDMSLSQALKFVAQESQLELAKQHATQVYYSAFGNRE